MSSGVAGRFSYALGTYISREAIQLDESTLQAVGVHNPIVRYMFSCLCVSCDFYVCSFFFFFFFFCSFFCLFIYFQSNVCNFFLYTREGPYWRIKLFHSILFFSVFFLITPLCCSLIGI